MSRVVTTSATAELNPTSYDTTNYSWYSSSSMANGYNPSNNTTYATINLTRGSNAETYVYWKFTMPTFPAGATLVSVTCKAKGYISTTNNSRVTARNMQMYTGTTAKGSATTISNSATEVTLSVGSWTFAELQNARIRIYAKRGTSNTNSSYSLRFYGATLSVTYSYQETWYTVDASSSVSSVTVTPATQEYAQGGTAVVRFDGLMNGATVTDNGVDVTSSLVLKQDTLNTSSVDDVSGTSYHFRWDGVQYYVSNNQGVASSTALSRINMYISSISDLTMHVVNYAEATYDYGIVGNLDVALSTAQSEDANKKWSGKSSSNNTPNEQTITFSGITAGNHFIDIKYFKDQYTNSNYDCFKVRYDLVERTPSGAAYYEYTISNLSADHTVLVSGGVIQTLPIRVKQSGTWRIAQKVFVKQSGTWRQAIKVLVKDNGTWH